MEQWGIDVNHVPSLKDIPAHTVIDNLAAYIPQATTRLDLARLRLNLNVPQIAMQPSYGNWSAPSLWEDGIPALMANYNISAGRSTNYRITIREHSSQTPIYPVILKACAQPF